MIFRISGDDSDRDDREAGLHDSDDLQRHAATDQLILAAHVANRTMLTTIWLRKKIELSWCVSVLLMHADAVFFLID